MVRSRIHASSQSSLVRYIMDEPELARFMIDNALRLHALTTELQLKAYE